MKKLMILGAGIYQVPLIKKAKEINKLYKSKTLFDNKIYRKRRKHKQAKKKQIRKHI